MKRLLKALANTTTHRACCDLGSLATELLSELLSSTLYISNALTAHEVRNELSSSLAIRPSCSFHPISLVGATGLMLARSRKKQYVIGMTRGNWSAAGFRSSLMVPRIDDFLSWTWLNKRTNYFVPKLYLRPG